MGFFVGLLAAGFSVLGVGKAEASSLNSVNQEARMAILSDENLWDDDAHIVAARLGLKKESETAIDSVYRAYPGLFSRSFGGQLKSAQLTSVSGKPSSLNLVFSNMGDGGGGGADLKGDIRRDKSEIFQTLTSLFGRGEPTSLGRGTRREAGFRWDWEGHSFVLIHRPDSYVALRIFPAERLNEGHDRRTRDSQVKRVIAERVIGRQNGDVVLAGLPMVDQGEKGYCVPAIWEMALRSMGVEADMYLLGAEMASEGGGGTDLRRAVDVGRAVAEEGGRKMTMLRMDGNTQDIARWIDKGIPLIWAMRCSEQFVEAGLERTAKRRGMTDPVMWKQSQKEDLRVGMGGGNNWFGHVCLIIGYNHETGEIAISDSWGDGHQERWHSQKEVEAVSSGEFFAFDF